MIRGFYLIGIILLIAVIAIAIAQGMRKKQDERRGKYLKNKKLIDNEK